MLHKRLFRHETFRGLLSSCRSNDHDRPESRSPSTSPAPTTTAPSPPPSRASAPPHLTRNAQHSCSTSVLPVAGLSSTQPAPQSTSVPQSPSPCCLEGSGEMSHTVPQASATRTPELRLPGVRAAPPPIPPRPLTGEKLEQRRAKIVEEIYATEKTYVMHLGILVSLYRKPMSQVKGITSGDILGVFSNVDTIHMLHVELLQKITKRVTSWSPSSVLGDLFLEAGKWIKLYRHYISNYDSGQELLKRLEEQNSEFRKLSKRVVSADTPCGLTFGSFLIVPVQRIPRYLLLLRELVQYTDSDHPDAALLADAIKQMSSIADYINEKKRITDNQAKIEAVKRCWKKYKDDLFANPERTFIRDFGVSVDHGRVRLFLFNDIAVVTSFEKSLSGKFVFKYQLDLQDVAFRAEPDGRAFRLLGPQNSLHGSSDTESVVLLKETVERHQAALVKREFRDSLPQDPNEVSAQFMDFKISEYRARRYELLCGLIDSELKHIELLESCCQFCRLSVTSDAPVPESIKAIFNTIAEFLEGKYNAHSEFLKLLETRKSEWPEPDTASDLFGDLLEALADYPEFYKKTKEFRHLYAEAKSVNEQFRSWAQTTTGIDLMSNVDAMLALGIVNVKSVTPYNADDMQKRYRQGYSMWDTPEATQLDLQQQGALNELTSNTTEYTSLAQLWRMTAAYYTALEAFRHFSASGLETALFLGDDIGPRR
eukprot:m51a1_g3033 putative pleckstrin domain-containing protein (710) ;mRNA; f:907717-911267